MDHAANSGSRRVVRAVGTGLAPRVLLHPQATCTLHGSRAMDGPQLRGRCQHQQGHGASHRSRNVELSNDPAWRNPRVHLHFTPTDRSRLHRVERWLALVAERAIRRNAFTNVRELKQQIELFMRRYNADTSPFRWAATAASILQKIERIAKLISATGH